ncbi:MAG: alpha/beta hydrolase [Henriciella sp.]|nr:alpha/beta hydrolase [Henriciella sp.]
MIQDMPTDCEKPSLLSSLRELGTPLEFLKFPIMTPSLAAAPRGDGRKVILLPGFTAPELSMQPLALYLRYLGYDASTWGLGVNDGAVDQLTQTFGQNVQDVANREAAPVTLIGWSLGGVIARETARLFSPSVREVITMGTPLIGGPKYTSVGAIYARREGLDMDAFEQEVHERNSIGLSQPLTVIYSKSDGVVGWQAARDVYNNQARNIVVRSTHFAMGTSPTVWKIVANTLAGKAPV